ncbi:hypothetical protein PR202_gb28019 [Eleusine coracana subsp. coracana]|uniref:NB-ARC domain-containing protein n=1 Tax=Eleusine coracana subsp. coracana TaxID=191504 RepID=A0AAV5FWC9_ELECO|nr:hypothetical protein PR202_gb28019 [Eleusine coracana subsp. coracana]
MAAVFRVAATEPSRKRKRLWPNVDLDLRQRWELDACIVQINERLGEINKSRRRFRLQAGDGRRTATQPMQRPRFLEAVAHRNKRSIGRTKEKAVIIRALISNSNMDLPVISIWGTAGIGKTTLARMVYSEIQR